LLGAERFFEFPDSLLCVLPPGKILLQHLDLFFKVAVLLSKVATIG
jgi:hypothetical protein